MTLEQMKARLSGLLEARFSGVNVVSYEGKRIEYRSAADLAAAIADLERRIAAAEGRGRSRAIKTYAVKDL
jgi:hypothetical protein